MGRTVFLYLHEWFIYLHEMVYFYGFHVVKYGFHVVKYGFHVVKYGFHVVKYGFHVVKYGFHVGKYTLRPMDGMGLHLNVPWGCGKPPEAPGIQPVRTEVQRGTSSKTLCCGLHGAGNP